MTRRRILTALALLAATIAVAIGLGAAYLDDQR